MAERLWRLSPRRRRFREGQDREFELRVFVLRPLNRS
jgi:hypothetical protein